MTSQRGLTLVELMVALLLGLILIGAISAIFVGTRNGYTATTAVSGQSDGARFAIDTLSRAIRSTGFIGCTASLRTLNTLSTTYGPVTDFSNALSGYEASSTNPGQTYTVSSSVAADNTATDWSPNLPSGDPIYGLLGSGQGNVVQGSDVLVVHGTLPLSPAPATGFPSNVEIVTTVPTGYASISALIPQGSLAAISDCTKAAVFQVSSTSPATGTQYLLHQTGGTYKFNNSGAFSPPYSPGAMIYIPSTSFLYIGLGSDGRGALYKSDLTMNGGVGNYSMLTAELVPDVDNMQILYGVDPGSTGGATQYVRADQVTGQCSGGSWNCVVSVSVALLMSSPSGAQSVPGSVQSYNLLGTVVKAPQDTRQRSVYQFSVSVRNNLS